MINLFGATINKTLVNIPQANIVESHATFMSKIVTIPAKCFNLANYTEFLKCINNLIKADS